MNDKQAANATVDDHLRSMLALMKRGAVVSLTDIPNDPTFISSHIYRDVAKAIAERIEAALSPAPQEQMTELDWSNFDGLKRNVEWTPDDQDLIYTAMNYRDDDYGDADEDVGQQLVERLLDAWKRTTEVPGMTWEPIATAPRDGTVILLCGGAYHGYPFSGKWDLGPFGETDRPWLNVINDSRLYEHVPQKWMSLTDAQTPSPPTNLEGEEAEWIKTCTAKISNAIGGGSELFIRRGEQYRLDIDFVCERIREMRNRQHEAMHRAIRAERKAGGSANG